MTSRPCSIRLVAWFVVTAIVTGGGCVAEIASPDGTRGAPGSGGETWRGSGGATSSGGAPGSGGVTGSGGALGSGGRAGSGGAPGSGGSVGSGGNGASGSGGRSSGGTSGAGGRGTGGTGNRGGSNGSGGRGGAPATGGSSGACTQGPPPSGGTQHCSSNMSGNVGGGYSYTIWSSGSGGCITPYGVDATFKATWNNSGDFLARVGLTLGRNKTFDQYGAFAADFNETKSGTAGGFSYIGIYGWSVDPLHEYYIVDDWFGSRPNPGTKVGSITVDGGTYDILTHQQVNQPAIIGGNQTFTQFWSLRTTPRTCGHISISEHFKAWKNAGMVLGKLVEAKILIEAGGGTGNIVFTSATVTVQ